MSAYDLIPASEKARRELAKRGATILPVEIAVRLDETCVCGAHAKRASGTLLALTIHGEQFVIDARLCKRCKQPNTIQNTSAVLADELFNALSELALQTLPNRMQA